MPPSRLSASQVFAATLAVVGVFAGLYLTVRFGLVLVTLFIAILLAVAVRPIVGFVERRIGSRMVADGLVHVVLVGLVLAFVVALLPLVVEQVSELIGELPTYYQTLRQALIDSRAESLHRIGQALPHTLSPPAEGGATPLDAVSEAFDWLGVVAQAALTGTAVLVLSFYWILEGDLITRSVLLLLPEGRRKAAAELADAAGEKLSAYVRGQVIVCAAVGLLAFVAYQIIGLPNTLALAIMAGILEAVPVLGPTLGAIPALLLALTIDPALAAWVVVATLVIQGVENYVLVPRVMDRSVGVNPLITLLAFSAFGSALGIVGAFLAIPLAALLQLVIGRFLLRDESDVRPAPEGRDVTSALRYEAGGLILDLRRLVRRKEGRSTEVTDVVEDELEHIAAELDRLLASGAAGPADAAGHAPARDGRPP